MLSADVCRILAFHLTIEQNPAFDIAGAATHSIDEYHISNWIP